MLLSSLVAALVPGCGLALDLDPPDLDAGAGAGIDASPRDAGPPDSARFDARPPDPCEGRLEGDSCGPAAGPRLICLGGACVPSVCGDEHRDPATEECDDGNDQGADGCEPVSCVRTCRSHTDCDDLDPCDGTERCVDGDCVAGELPTDDVLCRSDTGRSGACVAGRCIPYSCGDEMKTSGEECDDGNAIAGDGCEPDCRRTCSFDRDCDDGDACTGIETCTNSGCVVVGIAACDPPDACHFARCDPVAGCEVERIDEDADGHSPIIGTSACGDDCDDLDPSVWLGAPEQCNSRDDDCDGVIDEAVRAVGCRPDADGDGYGADSVVEEHCVCASGWTTTSGDCFDRADALAAQVRPDQRAFFADPWCAPSCSFDYDCDGSETPRWMTTASPCRYSLTAGTCAGSGWSGGAVPSCGAPATWVQCSVGLGLGGSLLCEETRSIRRQQCR